MKSCSLWQVDCTRSGIMAGSGRSTFLLGFRPKMMLMWITRVWNPLSEFPNLLQVLQKKVRQNVIWGYRKVHRRAAVHFSINVPRGIRRKYRIRPPPPLRGTFIPMYAAPVCKVNDVNRAFLVRSSLGPRKNAVCHGERT